MRPVGPLLPIRRYVSARCWREILRGRCRRNFQGRTSHEQQRRDRGPRGRLRLDHAATAAPPRRGHLHPRGMDRRRGRQPDRGEPWRVTPRRSRSSSIRSGSPIGTYSSTSFWSTEPTSAKPRRLHLPLGDLLYERGAAQVAEETIRDVDASGHWPGKTVTKISEAGPLLGGRGRRSGLLPALSGLSGRLKPPFPRHGVEAAHRETVA